MAALSENKNRNMGYKMGQAGQKPRPKNDIRGERVWETERREIRKEKGH